MVAVAERNSVDASLMRMTSVKSIVRVGSEDQMGGVLELSRGYMGSLVSG